MKLYELAADPNGFNEDLHFVKTVAALCQVDLLTVEVDQDK